MTRIALLLEYDGATFHGWQLQPGVPTVQACLEESLSALAGEPIRVHAAGRTDAGVHASGQVVHFDTQAQRPITAWTRGTNARLPPQIAVLAAQIVRPDFHARNSAMARRYRYLLLNRPYRPALGQGRVGWLHTPLDVEAMRQGASYLIGTHDFSSFRAAQCQAHSPIKTLHILTISRCAGVIRFDFAANAFLHHMVRNIVGALLVVGQGKRSASWVAQLLAARDRRHAPATFAPDGLYLSGVDYPAPFQWPDHRPGEADDLLEQVLASR
jgi:tRNA pseudouridine38-40 synthase